MNFTDLINKLSKYGKKKIVFVGLGNELRTDDGVGIEFIKRLKAQREFKNSHFIIAERNPENFLYSILSCNPEVVVFIDAANWDGVPGEIKFFNDDEIKNTGFSTHTYSIKMIKDFLAIEGKMDFIFIGIQPFSTDFGFGLSTIVKTKIDEFFDVQN